MPASEDYFVPEEIDEQIDQLKQQNHTDTTDEVGLVNTLRAYYQTTTSDEQGEEQAFLQRARQRILASAHTPAQAKVQNAPVAKNSRPQTAPAPRRSRIMRTFQGLAAVLAVTALLAGWFIATQALKQPKSAALVAPNNDLFIVHHGIAYHLDGQDGSVLWQHAVPTRSQADPGRGSNGSIQVANHVVYVMHDFDIYALKADTGVELWHKTTTSSQAYLSLVVSDDRIYLYSLDTTFSALNATDGSLIWQNTAFHTENGSGFSVNNNVLYALGSATGSTASQIYALDAVSGKIRWHFPLNGFSVPIVAQGMVYLTSEHTVFGLSEQTGSQLWSWAVPTATDLSEIHLVNGTLYANTIDPMAKLGMSSNPDLSTIFAIDVRTGTQIWSSDQGYTSFNLTTANGLLLASRVHNGAYSVAAFETTAGKVAWETPSLCSISSTWSQQAQPACGVTWSELTGANWSLLLSRSAATGKNAFDSAQTTMMVYTLDQKTGKILATHQLQPASDWDNAWPVGSSNGLVYLQITIPRSANSVTYSDYAYAAYDLSNGSRNWRFDLPALPKPASPDAAPENVQVVIAA